MSKTSILIVEDDAAILQGLKVNLSFEGYGVLTARDGDKGWDLYQRKNPDLVILDIMLPSVNGFELCKMIKRVNPHQAVLFLSAKGEEVDRIMGLDLGADDYMVKPFSVRELVARVKAILRRSIEEEEEAAEFRFGDMVIDFPGRQVKRKGQVVVMTTLEFDLLAYFVRNVGRALSREELLNKVWGHDYFGTARTIDNFVTKLRQKLEHEPKNPTYFLSLRGLGYKFELTSA
jgi:two-component system, OmpR family, alkaline phosphatase synthesis response regulator PhoP